MEQIGIFGLEFEAQLQGATKEEFVQLMAALQRAFQQVRGLVFPGQIVVSAGATVPAGCLPCDGALYEREKYADLFEEIQTTWGAGDGLTTFAVPDLRGRTLIGAGTGTGLSARTLAALVGTESHVLTIAELPAHTPAGTVAITDPGHDHTPLNGIMYANGATDFVAGRMSGEGTGGAGATSLGQGQVTDHITTGITASFTGTPVGSGAAHSSLQPSAVVNYFIRY